jgi:hypothetical protein
VLVKLTLCGLKHHFSWKSLKVGTSGLCSVFQKLLRTDPLEMCLYIRAVHWEIAVIPHASLLLSVIAIISEANSRYAMCKQYEKQTDSPSVLLIVWEIIQISLFRYKSSTLKFMFKSKMYSDREVYSNDRFVLGVGHVLAKPCRIW